MIKLGQMFRISVIASMSLLAACDVGSVLAHEGGGDGGGDDGAIADNACPPAVVNGDSGHHAANGMPGDAVATAITSHEGCMGQAGCHNINETPGASGPYDYGGEAFKDAAGTIPYAGATILLSTVGATPQYQKLTVAQNGFFYLASGTGFPAPSATVSITAALCDGTNKTSMATSLAVVEDPTGKTPDGNCNGGTACHGAPLPTDLGAFIFLTPAS
jgi:hypothetical protein